jgi:plastocyanin
MGRTKLFVSIAVLALACLACSSSDNGGVIQTPPASTTPNTTLPAQGTPVAVSASDGLTFEPAAITITAGTKVVWTTGTVSHTVTAQSGATFDSGTLGANQTFSQTFSTPGTIKYFCTIHGQSMSGTITVT